MINSQQQTTVKGQLRTLTIIHLALVGGCVIALLMFSQNATPFIYSTPTDMLTMVSVLLPVATIFAGNILFKKQLGSIPDNATLQQKLAGYQTAFIVKCALIEGPTLFALIIFSSTHNIYNLIIGIILIVILFIQRPSKEKIIEQLNLAREERMQLEK